MKPGRPTSTPWRWRIVRYTLLVFVLAVGTGGHTGAADEATANTRLTGFVHQQGTEIHDGTGRPIKLRGVNLGGWLLWEGWIWGGGWDSETALIERFRKIVGGEFTEQFRRRIYEEFITEEDIRRIAEMGFNVVRVPFHHRILEDYDQPYVYKASGWKLLDNVIAWGERHGVYVLLDLHAALGAQNRLFVADAQDGARLWKSPDYQERTIALWHAIATRYANRRIVAGYDLLNEPSASDDDLVSLYKRIIAAIREVDENHMVVLEGGKASTDFSMFDRPLSNNQAYSFHMYTWFGDKRKKKLKAYRELSETHQVPIFCGEFGENKYEMLESTIGMFEDPRFGIDGWTLWTWKKVLNRYPALVRIEVDQAWRDWHRRRGLLTGRRPPEEEAEAKALMDYFLKASVMDAVRVDPRMEKLMTAPLKARENTNAGARDDGG